jgi:hypothetical protein
VVSVKDPYVRILGFLDQCACDLVYFMSCSLSEFVVLVLMVPEVMELFLLDQLQPRGSSCEAVLVFGDE